MADNTAEPKVSLDKRAVDETLKKVELLNQLITAYNALPTLAATETTSDIAGNVADAAKALSADIKDALENPRAATSTPVSAEVVIGSATPRRSGQR